MLTPKDIELLVGVLQSKSIFAIGWDPTNLARFEDYSRVTTPLFAWIVYLKAQTWMPKMRRCTLSNQFVLKSPNSTFIKFEHNLRTQNCNSNYLPIRLWKLLPF